MKKQLDFLVQYEDRISRLAKALKWKIYHLLFGFSAQASTLGVFKHASGLGSTNLQIFRFNFPTKRLWASLICSKTARYRLFLAVVRCCVTTTLAAETFSLLSVYLNYKFGLGLPSFHLFFSLFKFNALSGFFASKMNFWWSFFSWIEKFSWTFFLALKNKLSAWSFFIFSAIISKSEV